MSKFRLITDSCCDLGADKAAESNIQIIPMVFTVDGQEYHNIPDGGELSNEEFFHRLKDGASTSTSAVNMQTFIDVFSAVLREGEDILYIAFSSGLSSTCSAAKMAADELASEFPERRVLIVDSLCASLGEGLLVWLTARKIADGADIDAARDYAEQTKMSVCHQFTVDDLQQLKRGGRVSGATALVGSVLGIKPLLHVDDEGHLSKVGTVRGRRASLTAIVDRMAAGAASPEKQTVFICNGNCIDDAEIVRDDLMQRFGIPQENIYIHSIGPVIGAHSGQGTLAVFYLGSPR